MKAKNQRRQIIVIDSVESLSPTSSVKPTFNTLQEWFENVCDSSQPKKHISKYVLDISESDNGRFISLVGMNQYGHQVKIDFKPSNTFFLLPSSEFGNLGQDQVHSKVTDLLLDFIKTKRFENSFLADADSIVLNWKTIWTKMGGTPTTK